MVSVRQNLTGLRAALLTSLVAACGLASSPAAAATSNYDSYTDAYKVAGESHRPMLVVLNGDGNARMNIDELAENSQFATAAENYVVAEIDTNTDHGRKIHELFNSPTLPTVVVIDDDQKKQIFKTSRTMSAPELATVLNEYKDGPPSSTAKVSTTGTTSTPVTSSPVTVPSFNPGLPQAIPANCPSCKLKAMGLLP